MSVNRKVFVYEGGTGLTMVLVLRKLYEAVAQYLCDDGTIRELEDVETPKEVEMVEDSQISGVFVGYIDEHIPNGSYLVASKIDGAVSAWNVITISNNQIEG